MYIKIINHSSNPLPEYKTEHAAGADLMAFLPDGEITLKPFERKVVPTGLHIELPQGYEAQIRPRSGLAAKNGITVLNAPGTIDADYRGEVKVILINLSNEDFTVHSGDRIAQMIISRYEKAQFHDAAELQETARDIQGFGHTGLT